MLYKIAEKMSKYLVKKEVIQLEDIDIYQYGLEFMFSSIITNSSILIVAMLMDSFWIGLVYLITFIPLKMTCGGYHASTYERCYVISVMSYVVISFITSVLFCIHLSGYVWIGILFGSVLYIYRNSPVKNKNHPVKEQVLQKNKKRATILFVMESILVTVGYFYVKESIVLNFIVLTITSVAIFILPTKRKGEILC